MLEQIKTLLDTIQNMEVGNIKEAKTTLILIDNIDTFLYDEIILMSLCNLYYNLANLEIKKAITRSKRDIAVLKDLMLNPKKFQKDVDNI